MEADLTVYSRNVQNKRDTTFLEYDCGEVKETNIVISTDRYHALKTQRKALVHKYAKVKQVTLDYVCREDLVVTTLHEWLKVFVSSVEKNHMLHKELTDERYDRVGMAMTFDPDRSSVNLSLFLAAT